MTPRLPRPAAQSSHPTFWIDEAIWGNRLYDEQTPWMSLLEMLCVLVNRVGTEAFHEEPLPDPSAPGSRHGGVRFVPVRRMALRRILFDNPFLSEIQRRHADDEARWEAWYGAMKSHSEGPEGMDFSYLREVFPPGKHSFEAFSEVVQLLRATAIEGDSNKRWTSKFVFPYGPSCMYPDLSVKAGGKFDMDRRFFARTGELVYLMLCRSGRGEALYKHLGALVLEPNAHWNRLVERLQPSSNPASSELHTGYLPYAALPDYTAFAEDLLAVLELHLPGYDALPHLVDLIGLHLVLYILRRAEEWTPNDGITCLVLEIVAPKKTTVRGLAVESFASNARRTAKAVDGYITEVVEQSPEWHAACALPDHDERMNGLKDVLRRVDAPELAGSDPTLVLANLREAARTRHAQHFGEAHGAYAQAIGLASRRGTRRVRYAPSDQLLKTLVLTVVPERMEFQSFLAALWDRYSMVIGHHQAAEIIQRGDSDQEAFEENARRLEMRLASLGLLRRLSDACAYVENPVGAQR